MSAFLILTKCKRFSPDGDEVMKMFHRWEHRVLSEDPYTVVIRAGLTLDQLADELRKTPFEYQVATLEKSIGIRGAGAKLGFSMGAGLEDFF